MNRPLCTALTLALLAAARSPAEVPDVRCLETAPGECLQVTVTGRGRDVVLIPGLFGSAFAFRQVIPLLTERGRKDCLGQ